MSGPGAAPGCHPLDPVERFVAFNGWQHERDGDNALAVRIDGHWCAWRIWFGWQRDLAAVTMACAFDLQVPAVRRAAVHALLALINERLWIGHFDLFSDEAVPAFRHALMLGGQGVPDDEQLACLVGIALGECERFYPAFRYVVADGMDAAGAIRAAIVDPVGEA